MCQDHSGLLRASTIAGEHQVCVLVSPTDRAHEVTKGLGREGHWTELDHLLVHYVSGVSS